MPEQNSGTNRGSNSINIDALYNPRDVAEATGIEPHNIRSYCKEFKEFIDPYTVRTKELNGHRRFTEEGLKIFFEIKRLLNEKMTFAMIRNELSFRQKAGISPAEVIVYENQKTLKDLTELDVGVVERVNALIGYIMGLEHKIEDLGEQLQRSDNQIAVLTDRIAELTQEQRTIPDTVVKGWASVSREMLLQQKQGFFQKVFGGAKARKAEVEKLDRVIAEGLPGLKERPTVEPEVVANDKEEGNNPGE